MSKGIKEAVCTCSTSTKILVFTVLILAIRLDSPIQSYLLCTNGFFWFDTIKLEWPIVYIERSKVIMQKKCISFSEDFFCLSKQCRP